MTLKGRDGIPDAAELLTWTQRLRALGIPVARIAAAIKAGRSRGAMVEDLRAWLKARTKA